MLGPWIPQTEDEWAVSPEDGYQRCTEMEKYVSCTQVRSTAWKMSRDMKKHVVSARDELVRLVSYPHKVLFAV